MYVIMIEMGVLGNGAMRLVPLAVFVFVWTTSAMSQTIDWGLKSALLEEDMTQTQVVNAISYGPNQVSLETCGSSSRNGSWPCKILGFGSPKVVLRVLFRKSQEV